MLQSIMRNFMMMCFILMKIMMDDDPYELNEVISFADELMTLLTCIGDLLDLLM